MQLSDTFMVGYNAANMGLSHDLSAGNGDRVNKTTRQPFMEKVHINTKMPDTDCLPATSAALLVELQEGHHKGLIAEDYYKHKPVLGKIKIEDFAKDFALAYQKQVS